MSHHVAWDTILYPQKFNLVTIQNDLSHCAFIQLPKWDPIECGLTMPIVIGSISEKCTRLLCCYFALAVSRI